MANLRFLVNKYGDNHPVVFSDISEAYEDGLSDGYAEGYRAAIRDLKNGKNELEIEQHQERLIFS